MTNCSKYEQIVHNMNNNKDNQDFFDVLRKVSKNPETTQREMASDLGFSLGKLNYCLKALKKKGLVILLQDQKIYWIKLTLQRIRK